MATRLGWVSRRGLVIGAVLVVAASGTASALAAGSSGVTEKSAAHAVTGPRRVGSWDAGLVPASKFPFRSDSASVQDTPMAQSGGNYAAEGVTFKPSASLLTPLLSATSAVVSFGEQSLPQALLGNLLTSSTPTVAY